MDHYLDSIPASVRDGIVELAALVIERAHALGDECWGVTPRNPGFRLNVGWTEILTAEEDYVRLVGVGFLIPSSLLPHSVAIHAGKDERGFYPSIPGSVLAEVSYTPVSRFRRAIEIMTPAIMAAVESAGRRRAARGVRQGHSQELVEALALKAGRSLPSPGFPTVGPDNAAEGLARIEAAHSPSQED